MFEINLSNSMQNLSNTLRQMAESVRDSAALREASDFAQAGINASSLMDDIRNSIEIVVEISGNSVQVQFVPNVIEEFNLITKVNELKIKGQDTNIDKNADNEWWIQGDSLNVEGNMNAAINDCNMHMQIRREEAISMHMDEIKTEVKDQVVNYIKEAIAV